MKPVRVVAAVLAAGVGLLGLVVALPVVLITMTWTGTIESPATAPDPGTSPGQWGGWDNGNIPLGALCPIPWYPTQYLRCDATAALTELNTNYRTVFGHDLCITDAYRSYARQVTLRTELGPIAAPPGTSNHGWGLALDLGCGINRFGTGQHVWMRTYAPTTGWHHPTWAHDGKDIEEPWHWEYHPTGAAPE